MYLLNLTPIQGYGIPAINYIMGRNELPIEHAYLLDFTLFVILTVIGSYLLYRYFEYPVTQLRERFTNRVSPLDPQENS